jgi:hypothetical protein
MATTVRACRHQGRRFFPTRPTSFIKSSGFEEQRPGRGRVGIGFARQRFSTFSPTRSAATSATFSSIRLPRTLAKFSSSVARSI